jgi:hypothetical protein
MTAAEGDVSSRNSGGKNKAPYRLGVLHKMFLSTSVDKMKKGAASV